MDRAHVEVRNVTKEFRSSRRTVEALQNVTFSAARGEFVSLIGPSGCGKSTLLSLLAGLTNATRGELSVDGVPTSGPNTASGVVFQSDLLLSWRTAMENVLLQFQMRGLKPTKANRNRAEDLLEMVGVSEFRDAYPHELSGGMRQRVAICRALVHEPNLLLMDEPFGALDAITREQINFDLARIASESGKTVIFVTHSIDEAVFLSDRVVVMSGHPGRVAAQIDVGVPRPRRSWPTSGSQFDGPTQAVRRALASASAATGGSHE
ncbi:ABC transporter ATP-binding protein [Specibacter sp. RAF43]|uniref:ABC transporter ATP-binding protein n=1 Tax=Specibacter sp. RAF43 TaxID=3233057 RepID=UPI003F9E60D8